MKTGSKLNRIICIITICMMIMGMMPAAVMAESSGEAGESSSQAWDGKTVDVSWYNTTDTVFHIKTPAQLMGLAAIVNGMVHKDITTIIGDDDNTKIKATWVDINTGYASTGFGYRGQDEFLNKTIYIDADLDMGGVYNQETGEWSGARFMPIGGSYQLDPVDYSLDSATDEVRRASSQLNANFCGVIDGQGHTVSNIYAYLTNVQWAANVGFVGRLGVHDGEYTRTDKPTYAGVRNLIIGKGYIDADRSVGGIVGKVGKNGTLLTEYGNNGNIFIENCANFATIVGHQKKGTGGIIGACWNGVYVKNCYNAGTVSNSNEVGGIAGSNEGKLINCFNAGVVNNGSAKGSLATSNGGDSYENCYWLEGTAKYGVNGKNDAAGQMEMRTAEQMSSAEFLALINGTGRAFVADSTENPINGGYPVLRIQAGPDTATVTGVTTEGTLRSTYVTGQSFSDEGFCIWANYSDNTREAVEDYTITLGDDVISADYQFTADDNGKVLKVSGSFGGYTYSSECTIEISLNVPVEITNVTSKPSPLVYCEGEKIAISSSGAYVKFSNGTAGWIYAKNDENLTASIPDALTLDDNGKEISIVYTLNGTSVSYPLGTISVVPALTKNDDGVYQISTADDLRWYSAAVTDIQRGNNGNVNGELKNDIDMTGVSDWTAIGDATTVSGAFNGVFEGNGHTVTFACEKSGQAALFGYVMNGTVRNVTVAGYLRGTDNTVKAGIAAGLNGTGSISGCVNKADITSATGCAAGIVGKVSGAGSITDCVNEGSISSSSSQGTGGITGSISAAAVIEDCTNKGDVACTSYSVGGIVGTCTSASEIVRCINTASVSGTYNIGGIIGTSRCSVTDCYNTGDVTASAGTASSGAGGITGIQTITSGRTVSGVYNTGKISSSADSPSIRIGSIVGYINANMTIKNALALEGTAEKTYEASASRTVTGSAEFISDEALKAFTAVEILNGAEGDAWRRDLKTEQINGGYPILCRQTSEEPEEFYVAGITTETAKVIKGDTFTVNMTLRGNTNDLHPASFQSDFVYDSSLVKPVSITSDVEGATVTYKGMDGATADRVSFKDYTGTVGRTPLTVAVITFEAVADGTASFSAESAVISKTGDTVETVVETDAAVSVKVLKPASAVLIPAEEYIGIPDGYQVLMYTSPSQAGEGSAWAYDGSAMYYSEKLSEPDSYVYLYMISDEVKDASEAAAKIGTVEGAQPGISYDGDVNRNETVNIVDAQIVSDLAAGRAFKDGFSPCTMLMRFESDLNGDNSVTAADARAIHYYIHYNTFEIPAGDR